MVYLMQVLYMINDLDLFESLFNGLEDEVEELGYKGLEGELCNDILFNHFNLTIDDERQLEKFSKCVLNKVKRKAAINLVRVNKAS